MSELFDFVGHKVNRVGFGAMQLPGPGVMGPPKDHDEAVAVLRRAVELGVNHIDTAQFYGPDVSNALIREALYPYADDLVLVSKVGARRDDKGRWLPAQQPDELKADVEANLRALEVEQLGAVNLRLMPEHEIEGIDYDEQLAAMVQLRDEGKIAGIGVSTANLQQVNQAITQADIVCVQNAFSLLSQDDADVLQRCVEAGVAYVPYFPLGSAFAHMPKVADDERVIALAAKRNVTPAQIGLAWMLKRADNILLIPGTSSLAHLEENMAVGDIALSNDEFESLSQKR